MLVSDLLHSCAHEDVAAAAVASIGGSLAERLQAEAESIGISVGLLAAGAVRTFSREASEGDWRHLAEAVRGKDIPVLFGLEVILGQSRPYRSAFRTSSTPSAAVIAATRTEGVGLSR